MIKTDRREPHYAMIVGLGNREHSPYVKFVRHGNYEDSDLPDYEQVRVPHYVLAWLEGHVWDGVYHGELTLWPCITGWYVDLPFEPIL